MRYFLLTLIVMCTHLNATVDVPLSHLPQILGEEPEDDFGIRDKIRNAYHEKRYGDINPHAPFSVQYWPVAIDLPNDHQVPQHFVLSDGTVRLDAISHHDIEQLSDQELYNLLGPLSHVKVNVKWKDRAGHLKSGKNRKHAKLTLGLLKSDQTNAAAALILTMGAMGHTFEFCRMLALVPDAVMSEFKGHGIAIFTPESLALALLCIVHDMEQKDPAIVAQSSTTLIGLYLKYHAKKNNQQLEKTLHKIITHVYILLESSKRSAFHELFLPGSYNPMQIGTIFGSILAAAVIHADNIAKIDEKRVFLINTGSNLVWASTAFLGAVPMGGACATAVVGGVVSLGVVGAAAAYTKWGTHQDSVPTTKELEGRIQAAILLECTRATSMTKEKIFEMLHWMNTTIHLNGLSD